MGDDSWAALEERMSAANLRGQWQMDSNRPQKVSKNQMGVTTVEPVPAGSIHVWRWSDVQPLLESACVAMPESFTARRALILSNPGLHHVKLPVSAFTEIMKNPAVVAMKDSHRAPEECDELMALAKGQLSPWPQLALRDAVRAKNGPLAEAITADLAPSPGSPLPNLSWRETASKIGIRMAGYVYPGPLRPPFLEIPAEVIERQRIRIERWKELCPKYRPVAHATE